jgi:spore coat protein CotH
LSRAWRGVWNSRLQYTGDFDTLAEALAAIAAAYPEADRIRCYEYSVDDEYAREVAPLLRSGEKWLPAV